MDNRTDVIKRLSDQDPEQVLFELACIGAFIALGAVATLAMTAGSTAPTLNGHNQQKKNP